MKTKKLYAVGLGPGPEDLTAPRAVTLLKEADVIYVMSKNDNWILTRLRKLSSEKKVRAYYPQSAKWAEMDGDPVHKETAQNIAADLEKGKKVVWVAAGDLSIYAPFIFLAEHLKDLGYSWEIVPGPSFINAIPMATGWPVVTERSNLLVAKLKDPAELPFFFKVANTVVLYTTQKDQFDDIRTFALENNIEARIAYIGVEEKNTYSLDLTRDDIQRINGLVILKKDPDKIQPPVALTEIREDLPELYPYKVVDEIYDDTHELRCTAFIPELKSGKKTPGLLLFHGGGWERGYRQQFLPQAKLLAELGMAVFTFDYRIKSKHGTTPFESVDDAKKAFAWLKQHAGNFNLDCEKISIGGGSAGGHIAALAAIEAELPDQDRENPAAGKVSTLVLLNPVTDTSKAGYGADRIPGDENDLNVNLLLKTKMCPSIVFHGLSDTVVPYQNSVDFKNRATELGGYCELHLYEGQPHAFFNYELNGLFNHFYFDVMEKMVKFFIAQGHLEKGVERYVHHLLHRDRLRHLANPKGRYGTNNTRHNRRASRNTPSAVQVQRNPNRRAGIKRGPPRLMTRIKRKIKRLVKA